MSNAERDPSVLVSATIRHNRKIVALPSNDARWAWVVCLGAAKLRRPPGLFESRPVLDAILGDLSSHIESFVSARLLHVSPLRCGECRVSWPRVNGGVLVVHDFSKHQRTSTPRVQKHRASGVSGNGDETPPKRFMKRGETFPTGAVSQSPIAINVSPEGGPGETDLPPLTRVVDYLEERTGRAWHGRPGQALWDTLDGDIRQFGADRLLAEYAAFPGDRLDFGQLVFGVSNALHPVASAPKTSKADQEAEEARQSIAAARAARERVPS